MPLRKCLCVRGAVALYPALHKGVGEAFALGERGCGELRLEFGAAAKKIAQNAVHYAVQPLFASALLRSHHRLVHGGEVGNVWHVQDLRRANVEKRLEFALRPFSHQLAQHGAEGTQTAHNSVHKVLHERAVGTALRKHVGGELVRCKPAGYREGGCAAAVHSAATASISTMTSFGRRATSTQLRAGLVSPKSSA